jgi:DnaJ-class molecular chaperone
MYRDLKPCIRCDGAGRVPIEALGPDPHVHTVIGMAKCHGCNGTGRVPVCEPCEVERILSGDQSVK